MADDETANEAVKPTLGIRLDPGLRERIKALAAADGRTESNFARLHLEKAVEAEEAKLQREAEAAK